jgi:hypothetical protein
LPQARREDQTLFLSFADAAEPTVWRLSLAEWKNAALQVLRQGDVFVLRLTPEHGAGQVLARYHDDNAARLALMITQDALFNDTKGNGGDAANASFNILNPAKVSMAPQDSTAQKTGGCGCGGKGGGCGGKSKKSCWGRIIWEFIKGLMLLAILGISMIDMTVNGLMRMGNSLDPAAAMGGSDPAGVDAEVQKLLQQMQQPSGADLGGAAPANQGTDPQAEIDNIIQDLKAQAVPDQSSAPATVPAGQAVDVDAVLGETPASPAAQ